MGRRSRRSASSVVQAKGFSELAVERGYCTPKQIVEAMRVKNRLADQGQTKELSEILMDQKVLTDDQVKAIERAVRGTTVIAGFEILEKVGQGGMGAVFRARQIAMDRIVALKILPPSLAVDKSFKERFLREARTTAKLNHLNIINGIEVGESGKYMFFAMEFVEGRTANNMVNKGALDVDTCVDIISQIAEALVYANRNGLVHRDIKPENIMVTPQGVAKLCDLGLAKVANAADIRGKGGSENMDPSLTQSGMAVGTPHYISPEQARGESKVDTRSDIYSLGASFYHMITGKHPFTGSSAQAIMVKHLTEVAPSVCDVKDEVPEAYGQIISMMMARNREDRYRDPSDLLNDLRAAKAGEPVRAASFRGETSCAMPRKGRRGMVSARGGASRRGVTTGPALPVPGDRTTRVGPVAARGEQAPTGLLIGAGVALAALMIFLLMPKGSPGSQRAHRRPPAPAPAVSPATPIKGSDVETKAGDGAAPNATARPDNGDAPGTDVVVGAKHPPGVDLDVASALDVAEAPPLPDATPDRATEPKTADAPGDTKPVKLTAAQRAAIDQAYGAFLNSMLEAVREQGLHKARDAVKEAARAEAHASARDLTDLDIQDFEAALRFEEHAAGRMVNGKVPVTLRGAAAKRFDAKEGAVQSYSPRTGLMVELRKGTAVPVKIEEIDPQPLLEAGADFAELHGRMTYLALIGMVPEAREELAGLPEDRRAAFGRKLDLIEKVQARWAKEEQAAVEAAQPAEPSGRRPAIPQGATFAGSYAQGTYGENIGRVDMREATGVAVGDLNDDGRDDLLLVAQGAPTRVYLNTGSGFEMLPGQAGLNGVVSRTGHIVDVNMDGLPDMAFMARDRLRIYFAMRDGSKRYRQANSAWHRRFNNTEGSAWMDFNADGQPDFLIASDPDLKLLLQLGGGRVDDASAGVGFDDGAMRLGNGNFITTLDVNNDGYLDFLYHTPDRTLLAMNEGGKTFKAANLGVNIPSTQEKVGFAVADVNGDGWVDLFVPGEQRPMLLINNAGKGFADMLDRSGDLARCMPRTGGAAFLDVDLDGDQDLVVGGHDSMALYINDGQGKFTDATASGGFPNERDKAWYIGVLDANGDGMPDLFPHCYDKTSRLYLNRNRPSEVASALRVRFDTASGRTPIGARVVVTDAWNRVQTQWVSGGDGRGGQRSTNLIFGVPAGGAQIKVYYPGGTEVNGTAEVIAGVGAAVRVSPNGVRPASVPAAVAAANPQNPQPGPGVPAKAGKLGDLDLGQVLAADRDRVSWVKPGVLRVSYNFTEGDRQVTSPRDSTQLARDWDLNGAERYYNRMRLPGNTSKGPMLKIPFAKGNIRVRTTVESNGPGTVRMFALVVGQAMFFFDYRGHAAVTGKMDLIRAKGIAKKSPNLSPDNLGNGRDFDVEAELTNGEVIFRVDGEEISRVKGQFGGGFVGVLSSGAIDLQNITVEGAVDEPAFRQVFGLPPAEPAQPAPVAPRGQKGADAESQRPDLSGVFQAKPNWRDEGSVEFVWARTNADDFGKDWSINDNKRNRPWGEFALPLPKDRPSALLGFKGVSGEIWNHNNDRAFCLAPSKMPRISRFRLEIQFEQGKSRTHNYTVGVGLWDGANEGLVFGPRANNPNSENFRRPGLAMWGSAPNSEGNLSYGTPEGFFGDFERGQLAVQADGKEWTFYYRDFDARGEEGWKQVFHTKQTGAMQPSINPWSWGGGKLEFYVNSIRLVIAKDEPLLQPSQK